MLIPLHPLVTALLPEVRERRDVALRDRELDDELQRIEKFWAAAPLSHGARGSVDRIGMVLEYDATLALAAADAAALAAAFRNAVAFRSLAFRWKVFLMPHRADKLNLPISAWDTVKATGPAILGQWDDARTCAEALVLAAHLDQQYCSPEVRANGWGKGTVDALLVYLLCAAFGISTHYKPVKPVVPVYQALLEHWRTTDEALFRKTMQAAALFHIECCGDSTDDISCEFDAFFAQIFPLELLVIQALRQRDGLPAFDTGHALVDAPWAQLRTLPPAPLNPLLARLDQRLRQDYPGYR